MTNYDDGDDNRNKDGKNDDTTPRSYGGGLGDDGDGATAAAHYISTILKMCNKLLYAKFGVFNWCRCYTEKNPISINKRIDYIFEICNESSLLACP